MNKFWLFLPYLSGVCTMAGVAIMIVNTPVGDQFSWGLMAGILLTGGLALMLVCSNIGKE